VAFVARIVVNAVALWIAAALVPGIRVGGLVPLVLAGLVLGLVNALVRPVLVVLTLPLTLLTLGLFLLVLNALCVWLTSALVPGFDVAGFWPAFWAALLVSVVSWAVTALAGRDPAPK
jgi:putative membrane protein